MEVSTIQAIVSKANDLDCFDLIRIYDDNYRCYRIKSDTSTGYFDDGNKMVVCFSSNDNPIRNTMNESKFLLEFVDYDHITNITILLPDKDIGESVSKFDFDQDAAKAVIKNIGGTYQADGYLFDKDGNRKKTSPIPELILGTPYKPYKPNTDEQTEETTENGG